MRYKDMLTMRHLIMAAMALIIAALTFPSPTLASGRELLSGNTEDVTVQVACGNDQTLPVNFTINYQNSDRPVEYDHNTTPCPPPGGELGFDGELLPGIEGSGNIESVTFQGTVVQRNEGPTRFRDEVQAIWIDVEIYDYSGLVYIVIWISDF